MTVSTKLNARELEIVRRAYAKQVCAVAGTRNPDLEAAFAAIPREDYLGPGPWPILRGSRYIPTQDDDPTHLYTNDVVGLLPNERINNGQPSFHALLISAANPEPGDHIVHIGAGTGYYTAILAMLAGPSGRVTAVEIEDQLALRARSNLRSFGNVSVQTGDGTKFSIAEANVIYVNAGVTSPLSIWLDGLAEGGRLILPLTTTANFQPGARVSPSQGAVFCIEKRGDSYPAGWISNVGLFPCAGGRDDLESKALSDALANGNGKSVGSLVRRGDLPKERCWLQGPDWALVIRN